MAEHQRTDWDHVIGLAVAINYAAGQAGFWAARDNGRWAAEWQAIADGHLAELRRIRDVHVAYAQEVASRG